MRAFTSFGDGHGVWEKDGGPQLPFYARNLRDVRQWASSLNLSALMPTLLELQKNGFNSAPQGEGVARRLSVTPDRVQSHGLNLSGALRSGGTGLIWTALTEGELLPRTRRFSAGEPRTRASVIQVTNLGITVKDSPQNTLVFVTRLDTGAPVTGATFPSSAPTTARSGEERPDPMASRSLLRHHSAIPTTGTSSPLL
jgi:hypothetical protein